MCGKEDNQSLQGKKWFGSCTTTLRLVFSYVGFRVIVLKARLISWRDGG